MSAYKHIAECLSDWEGIARHFKIKPGDCDGVKKVEKKIAFLEAWKQRQASTATFNALIAGLRAINCNEDASELRKLAEGKLATVKYLLVKAQL